MYPTFEKICTAVEQATDFPPRGSSTRKKGMCPAHDDSAPSLSIRWDVEKKVVGLTCWAGCSFDDIVKALGLDKAEFRDKLPGARRGKTGRPAPEAEPEPAPRRSGKRSAKADDQRGIVARYPYTDADGKVLYYNVRFEPKDFRMAGPDGEMRELPKNLKRVPYNLPAVLEAVSKGRTVYWVEGEKDVATAAEYGEVATTHAGGGKTPPDPAWFPDYFAGAELVVVADRDKAGEIMARNIAQAAINFARSVRTVQAATPQAKSDLTDHLEAGYRFDQLLPLTMRSVRRTRWTLASILATKPEPLRWVLPGVIPEGLTLLVGAPKVGKSWWNLNLMAALGTGRPTDVFGWGQEMEPSPSLYLALEDPMRRIHDRMHKVIRNLGFKPERAGDVWLDLDPLDGGGREEIERWLDKNPDARAIMVDVLAKVRGSGEGQTMYQADYESIGALKEIADSYGIGMIVTHHDRKKTDDDFVNQVSGTKGITGAADTILYLTRERGKSEGLMKSESRDVEGCTYKMAFVGEFGRWQILERSDEDDDGARPQQSKVSIIDQVSQVILARGESSLKDVAKMIDVPEATVKRAAAAALADGTLAQTHNGLWYVPKAV